MLYLDSVHGDDVPALDTAGLIDDRTALYVIAESAVEELVDHGFDALQVELILAMLDDARELDIRDVTPRCTGRTRAPSEVNYRRSCASTGSSSALADAGIHTVPVTTTAAEREEIGRLIQRYRFVLLTWCRQAMDSAGASHASTRGGGGAPEVGAPASPTPHGGMRVAAGAGRRWRTSPQRMSFHSSRRGVWPRGRRCSGEHDFAGEHGRRPARHQPAADLGQGRGRGHARP